jgi:serine/threonine protein kinase
LKGTPIYTAPEMFPDSEGISHCDTHSDIYSLGCIIYEIIFEIIPWEKENIQNIFQLQKKVVTLNERPSIPKFKNNEINNKLVKIIKKCCT